MIPLKDPFQRYTHEDIEEMSEEEITKLKFSLGNYLYSTLNSIVHAKSNYTKTDTECPEDDMKRPLMTL